MNDFDFDFDVTEENTHSNVFGHLNTIDEIDADYATREAELKEELDDEEISEDEMQEAIDALDQAVAERLMELTVSLVNEDFEEVA